MNYHLSPRVILTNMQALAAVQSLAGNEQERALLAPILCRERNPLIAVMIRNAFADMVMRLGPKVADVSLGDETAGSPDEDTDLLDLDLHVELYTPRTFTSGHHATIRRSMEQGIAFNALSMWSLATAGTGSASAGELADRFAGVAADWHRALEVALTPGFYPGITEPYL